MTEILHTGDTHVGYRQYHLAARREDFLTAFRQVARDAVERDVDAVVHAGDLFHDRQPALTDVMGTISVLRTLADAGIPFLGVVGNHESKRDRQWLDLFEEMGLATRLGADPERVGDVALYGLDFVPRSRRDSLDYAFTAPPPGTEHAGLVSHGLFEPFEHGDWDAREILRASPVPFDIVLLGDDHTPRRKRLEEPHEAWLTYPGSTERASASEREARGYNLVSFDDGVDIRRRGLDTREFVFVDVELAEGEGTGRVRQRLRQHDLDGSVVVVTVTGGGEHVTPAEVETAATERGALVARVNDRRDREEEPGTDVSFANPDRAVERNIEALGLSPAARDIDETVRASAVADSNVADTVENRVREVVAEADTELFEPAAETPTDESAGTADDTDTGGATGEGPTDGVGADTDDEEGGDDGSADSQVTMGEFS